MKPQDLQTPFKKEKSGIIRYPPLYALYYKHITTLFPLPETHSLSRKFFSTYNSNSFNTVFISNVH
jgi:hypothetical protein